MPKSRKRKKKTKSLLEGGRRLPTPEEVLREHFRLFREKFGREPGPNDPVFFDPDSDVPEKWPTEKLDAAMEKSLRASEMPPQLIYAYKKTGLVLMEDSPASPEDHKAWLDATEEYFELERKAVEIAKRRVNRVRRRPRWLADKSGVAAITAVGLEHGRTDPKVSTLYKWKRALEAAGVRFIDGDDANGNGDRFKDKIVEAEVEGKRRKKR